MRENQKGQRSQDKPGNRPNQQQTQEDSRKKWTDPNNPTTDKRKKKDEEDENEQKQGTASQRGKFNTDVEEGIDEREEPGNQDTKRRTL